jgi:hypothetical protein
MSKFREILSLPQGKPMHAVVEAKSMFRVVPRLPDEQKGEWLRKAARIFGLTPSQAKKIEYEEVKDLRASRLDAMRAKLNELEEGARARREKLDDIQTRLTDLRSQEGRGSIHGHGRGVSPAGRGIHGDGAGRDGKG